MTRNSVNDFFVEKIVRITKKCRAAGIMMYREYDSVCENLVTIFILQEVWFYLPWKIIADVLYENKQSICENLNGVVFVFTKIIEGVSRILREFSQKYFAINASTRVSVVNNLFSSQLYWVKKRSS